LSKGFHKGKIMTKNVIALSVAASALAACVTINIYFPAAATEKAADKIIDEVWQKQPDQPAAPVNKPAEANPAASSPAITNPIGETK
jgi:hypothetical protein